MHNAFWIRKNSTHVKVLMSTVNGVATTNKEIKQYTIVGHS